MATSYAPSPRALPLGVAILAILIGLIGAIFLIASALWFVLSGFAYFHDLAFFGTTVIGAIVLLIVGVVFLVVALGLWRLELWALALSIVVILLLLVARVLEGALFSIGGLVLILLLIYLVLVRHHFV